MDWINSPAAWEAKALVAEVIHLLAEAGRLCSEQDCMARAEIAFPVKHSECNWEVGLCPQHSLGFAAQPQPNCKIGVPRRLGDEEPLAGPIKGPDEAGPL
tara:strand:+ start:495 stop:794 length:300 start_codon:yes stop_codon:yes gene_type:complete